ncbi:MAG: hypothetical protein AAGK32_14325, partial [Actinomycetota bacterium]
MAAPRVLIAATSDITLEVLLGSLLTDLVESGHDVHAASAASGYVDAVRGRGVTFHELGHASRSMAPWHDALLLPE